MADTKRQQIVSKVIEKLKTITTANGYNIQIGDKVYDWQVTPATVDDLPAIFVRDLDDTIDITIGLHEHNLAMNLEMLLKDSTTPEQAREGIADMVKLVGQNITWGGLAEDTRLAGEDLIMEQHEKKLASAMLRINIQFLTEPFNPYQ